MKYTKIASKLHERAWQLICDFRLSFARNSSFSQTASESGGSKKECNEKVQGKQDIL
jgi:hypothetical protein